MTEFDTQAHIQEIQEHLASKELTVDMHTALALELIGHVLAAKADQLTIALYETATTNLTATSSDPTTPAGPTGTPEFEHQVEDLAARLWETDQRKITGARHFHNEYTSIQDHYRDQAAYLLAPELSEEHEH